MAIYFDWQELKTGDRFRVAGYDDLFLKLNHSEAKCLGHGWTGSKATRMAKKFETVQFSPNVGGLILSI